MPGLSEELADLSALQQGLGQGENLHFAQKSSGQELNRYESKSLCAKEFR